MKRYTKEESKQVFENIYEFESGSNIDNSGKSDGSSWNIGRPEASRENKESFSGLRHLASVFPKSSRKAKKKGQSGEYLSATKAATNPTSHPSPLYLNLRRAKRPSKEFGDTGSSEGGEEKKLEQEEDIKKREEHELLKQLKKLRKQVRYIEYIQTAGIFTTVLLSYLSLRIYEEVESNSPDRVPSGSLEDLHLTDIKREAYIMKVVSIIISFVLALLEIYTYSVPKDRIASICSEINEEHTYFPKMVVYQQIFSSSAIKFLFLLVNAYPGMKDMITGNMLGGHYKYTFDVIIFNIIIFRMLLCLNSYLLLTEWCSDEFMNCLKESKMDLSYSYFLKLEANYHPLRLIVISSSVLCIYCGIVLSYLERSFDDGLSTWDKGNPNNNLWLSVVTMTTVGYGDGYPATHIGRFVAVIASVGGKIIITFLLSFSFFPLIELYLGNR